MKHKIGDKVKIKSLDWYNKNKNGRGIVYTIDAESFIKEMSKYCGLTAEIKSIAGCGYKIDVDDGGWFWTDDMFEELVEEENNDCEKCGLTRNSTRCLFMDNCQHNKQKNIIEIPKDYVLKDQDGNVINTTKIVLEKKKKEYPKTYEECCEIIGLCSDTLKWSNPFCINRDTHPYIKHIDNLMERFCKLFICRDAYWKIAGEEMGLGKAWRPDWIRDTPKYCIICNDGEVCNFATYGYNRILAFPTEEMRDAFYENFKELIEECKELL